MPRPLPPDEGLATAMNSFRLAGYTADVRQVDERRVRCDACGSVLAADQVAVFRSNPVVAHGSPCHVCGVECYVCEYRGVIVLSDGLEVDRLIRGRFRQRRDHEWQPVPQPSTDG